jgi:hypothetical protein
MKNRLEIAKRLLKPQGFLCCQVNESESYYLKVLLDEFSDVTTIWQTICESSLRRENAQTRSGFSQGS